MSRGEPTPETVQCSSVANWSRRLIYLATLALMVGHPGFGFRKDKTNDELENSADIDMASTAPISSSDEVLASKERGRTVA